MQIKVLTYNIHKGFRMGGKRFVLHEIRQMLRSTDVDLVFLQEVYGQSDHHAATVPHWPISSQYEFLADSDWGSFSYGQNNCIPGRHHGNAILSRFPITSWEQLNISTNRLEKRGALLTKVRLPQSNLDLDICCTHLNLGARSQQTQVQKIASWLNEKISSESPLIMAGDFNDVKDLASATLSRSLGLSEAVKTCRGRLNATFPSLFPVFCLDRIYVRGFDVIEAQVLREKVWRKLSDHLPVYAILSRTDKTPY